MATRVLVETGYTFNPATRTVTIPRAVPVERLVSITNLSRGVAIYGVFAGPDGTNILGGSVSISGNTTTVNLSTGCAGMNAGDKLQIVIDDAATEFTPTETQLDSINKLRVSEPQALIDTDFEYGPQVTKWENLAMVNMQPFAFNNNVPITVTGITIPANSRAVTVLTTTPPAVGSAVTIQDSLFPPANGTFLVESISAGVSFTYSARSQNGATAYTGAGAWDSARTLVFQGNLYSNVLVGGATVAVGSVTISGNTIDITTAQPHGLALGSPIAITGYGGTNPPNGSFNVLRVLSDTQFSIWNNTGTWTTPSGNGSIYKRPGGLFLHRPFDGGVIFSSNAESNFEQAVRQTRRYFRYQSGKGIMMSSGTLLKPTFQLDALSASGTTITVQTKEQHNIQPGAVVTIYGANESAYNGTFTVTNVTGYNTFTYTALSTPSASPASGQYYCTVSSWYGAINRMGLFDQQNGVFFEFDGQNMNVVRRNSTYQISGTVTATANNATITGSGTVFANQLAPGDFIVLRGQSYRVERIASNTSLVVSPPYRGVGASNIVVSKTVETRIPQSQWNLDKCDGTGPSGYNIDPSKMQMYYIDYSWYGAGFIRWGLRATNGNIVYVHKMPNNNVNSEAYLRSGNLPARYETVAAPPTTFLTSSIDNVVTTIPVTSTAKFPSSGTLVIKGSDGSNEFVNYTGTTATSFTGVTRGKAGASGVSVTYAAGSVTATATTTNLQVGMRVTAFSNVPNNTFISAIVDANTFTMSKAAFAAGSGVSTFFPNMGGTAKLFTQSATQPVSVELAWPQYAPSVSHWGTAAIMDGRYDDDKSLLFTYGQNAITGLVPSQGTYATSGTANAAVTSSTTLVFNSVAPAATNLPAVGAAVTGTGVPAGTIITAVSGSTNPFTLTLSKAVTVASGATVNLTNATSRALMSIRIAPSVDNGRASLFSTRELINRMQLVLRALDISIIGGSGTNILVSLVINGQPTGADVTWSAINSGSNANYISSSLGQIADYSTVSTAISTASNTGEITGGYLVSSTGSIPLDLVRDLGNSVLGGGSTSAGTDYASRATASPLTVYPDGPDVLTVLVQNLSPTTGVGVVGRLSWTEAQA